MDIPCISVPTVRMKGVLIMIHIQRLSKYRQWRKFIETLNNLPDLNNMNSFTLNNNNHNGRYIPQSPWEFIQLYNLYMEKTDQYTRCMPEVSPIYFNRTESYKKDLFTKLNPQLLEEKKSTIKAKCTVNIHGLEASSHRDIHRER